MKGNKDSLNKNKTVDNRLLEAVERYFAHAEQNPPSPHQNLDEQKVYERIQRQIARAERRGLRPASWLSIAAAILVTLGVGLWWMTNNPNIQSDFEELSIKENPVLPGNNTAILTLADGSKISLDEMQVGTITTADGILITKDENGQISYQHTIESDRQQPITHTLETPKGGQYSLVLPDGSTVWLNAASKIKYPSEFTGLNREVELEGEAYFEVAHNPAQPFIITTPQQRIQVLGTSFNVYAYLSEAEQTTLVEGSVKVKSDTREALLVPGQQAIINDAHQIAVRKVDPLLFTAWKDGDFSFQNTHIKDVINQISRWYNIEIVHDKESSNLRLSGMVSRSRHLDTVLEVLEMTDKVKFQLEVNPKTQERRIRIISI